MSFSGGRGHRANPRVTVVIPTYNAEPFIRRTITSVLDQSFDQLEVVVVDDGSSDGTPSIVEAFGEPVQLIRQTNAGVAAARNRALAAAHGELIAFLDHDDVWYPDKLLRQVALLDASPETGLVYGNAQFIDLADKRLWTYLGAGRLHRGNVLVPLFLDCFIPLLTAVVRADVLRRIGDFATGWRIAEDYDLFLRAAEVTQVDYVEDIVAGYRVHPGNLSRNYGRRIQEEQEVLTACLGRNPSLGRQIGAAAVRLRMAGVRCEPGHVYLFTGQFSKAARYFGTRTPVQILAAVPMLAASLLGPQFVMGARRVYRWAREGVSESMARKAVQNPS